MRERCEPRPRVRVRRRPRGRVFAERVACGEARCSDVRVAFTNRRERTGDARGDDRGLRVGGEGEVGLQGPRGSASRASPPRAASARSNTSFAARDDSTRSRPIPTACEPCPGNSHEASSAREIAQVAVLAKHRSVDTRPRSNVTTHDALRELGCVSCRAMPVSGDGEPGVVRRRGGWLLVEVGVVSGRWCARSSRTR